MLQGLTVAPLMRRLGLHDDGSVDHEARVARAETARAAIAAVDGERDAPTPDGEMVRLLRRKYQPRLQHAELDGGSPHPEDEWPVFSGVVRRTQRAERMRLSDLRTQGVIGDDALHRVEEELDWAEVNAEAMRRGNEAPGA